MPANTKRHINPHKLLHSKWTAVKPCNKEKHFIVVKLLLPEDALAPLELIELEAVYSNRIQIIAWPELLDTTVWQQGWC